MDDSERKRTLRERSPEHIKGNRGEAKESKDHQMRPIKSSTVEAKIEEDQGELKLKVALGPSEDDQTPSSCYREKIKTRPSKSPEIIEKRNLKPIEHDSIKEVKQRYSPRRRSRSRSRS